MVIFSIEAVVVFVFVLSLVGLVVGFGGGIGQCKRTGFGVVGTCYRYGGDYVRLLF
jgi:hypothetical protein